MNLEFLRFLFVGIGSNIINFSTYILIYSIGVPLFSASIVGYSAGLIVSYHFGRVWVFSTNFGVSKKNVFRFLVVYVVGGLGMSSIIELLDEVTTFDYKLSWFFGAVFAVVNNFFGLKWFVFNRRDV